MNVYFFELKAQLRSFIIWTLSIVILCAAFMGSVLPLYMDGKATLQPMLDSFPPSFTKIFGIDVQNIFGFEGFYTFVFLYLGMAAAIMAVSFTVSIFYREKRTKSFDFLLSKPRTRSSLFFSKLAASLTLIVGANVFYVLTLVLMTAYRLPDQPRDSNFYWAALSLFFTQILFMSFGVAYAIFAKRIRSVAGTATSFGIVGFVLVSASNLIGITHSELFSPLSYFSPAHVFENGFYDPLLFGMATALTVFFILLGYFKFTRGDAQAE